jgi:hypothetical protein
VQIPLISQMTTTSVNFSQRRVYLDEGIIEQEHRRCQIPHDLGFPKDNLGDVADITNLRVPKTKLPVRGWLAFNVAICDFRDLPQHKACVEDEKGHHDGQNHTGDQPKNRIGMRESHDRQPDVFGEEQSSSLNPELDLLPKQLLPG